MKMGRNIADLANEIMRQAASKKDYTADTRKLEMVTASADTANPTRQVRLNGVNGGMFLRATAHAQLAAALQIPKPFYDRLLTSYPDLVATNVNRLLAAEPARKMIRTLDNEVRAILSAGYQPKDNIDLLEATLPKILDMGANVLSCEVTESRVYLKAVTDKIGGELKVGDHVQAGLIVSNSEIGYGAVNVQELDYHLVCTNGMIREKVIRKTHAGRAAKGQEAIEDAREYYRDETRQADDTAFWMKVTDAVGSCFSQERFDKRLLQYKAAMGMPIPVTVDVPEVVERVAKRFAFNETERGSILNHLVRGGDLSKWGMAEAITRAAQDDSVNYDRSTEFEKFGGDLIDLPATEWKSLVAV